METNFYALFSGLLTDDKLKNLAMGMTLKNITVYKDRSLAVMDVESEKLVTENDSEKMCREIASVMDLQNAQFNLTMPPEVFSGEYYATLVSEVNRAVAASNGFFKDSSASFDGKVLKVYLAHGGLDILKDCGCDAIMSAIIKKRFGRNVDIEFCGDEVSLEDERVVSMIREAEANVPKSVVAEIRKKQEGDAPSKPKEHQVVEGIPLYL